MKKAFVFYGWFKGQNDKEPFIARILDNTTNPNSWRIDNHDKSYFFALKETFLRECTSEEKFKHIINRESGD